jgi:prepilin-type N-terminal cleavage/methylation domain-containing protein
MSRRPRAFTLIEVLVVITILAVLAAVILSATSQSRRSGDTAVCTSNLRQAAQALEIYLQDGDGTLPFTLYHDFAPILPYLGDGAVLRCPLDPYQQGANWQASRSAGKQISFFAPLTVSQRFMKHLPVLDPNHGVFVCLVHGQRRRFDPTPEPVNTYHGMVLRARKDTSVTRVQVPYRCFVGDDGSVSGGRMYWELFTDAPIPAEVRDVLTTDPDAREVPCSDVGLP